MESALIAVYHMAALPSRSFLIRKLNWAEYAGFDKRGSRGAAYRYPAHQFEERDVWKLTPMQLEESGLEPGVFRKGAALRGEYANRTLESSISIPAGQ